MSTADDAERARRLEQLVRERTQTLRRLELGLTDERLLEAATRMATYQLRDEEGPPTGQMPVWPRPAGATPRPRRSDDHI